MSVQPKSSGWASYFEMHYSQQISPVQTEATMYAFSQKYPQYLSSTEYIQCVYDAYNTYHTITADVVASYVVEGHIQASDYQNIVGSAFSGLAYFELHFSQQTAPAQTETQMYACIASGIISDADYVQCFTDAYSTYQTVSLANLQSYVASGHLTSAQYQTITGQTYGS